MSVEYEKMTLGGFLADNNLLDDKRLSPDLFLDNRYRIIFDAMAALRSTGAPVDLLTIADSMNGQLEKIGGASFLATLGAIPEAAANAEFYIEKLFEASRKRKIRDLSKRMKDEIDAGSDADEILLEIESAALELRKVTAKIRTVDNSEALHDAVERLETTVSGKRNGLRTGFTELDHFIGDLEGGQLLLIGARTSVGKTALALSIAHKMIGRRIRAAFVSLEMSRTQIFERLLAMQSGLPIARVRGYGSTPADIAEIMKASGELSSAPFALIDSPRMNVASIRAWLLGQVTDGARVAFIDYSGLIDAGDGKAPRWEKMADVSAGLKALARELNIPLFVLCQLNRTAAQDEEPRLDHLRDSGSFEQDADVVILLERKKGEDDAEETVSAALHVAKNRNGGTGYSKLIFRRYLAQFREAQT